MHRNFGLCQSNRDYEKTTFVIRTAAEVRFADVLHDDCRND